MEITKDQMARGIVLTVLGAGLWGVCGTCGQFLFTYKGVTSDWLVPVRLTSAGLLILLWRYARDGKKIFALFGEPEGRRDILIFAVFGMMLCQYSYFTTIQYSNAGTATVLQYTGPAMILAYLCVRARRRPRGHELLALACAMAGTFLIATHGKLQSLAIPPRALFWGMAAAVTSIIYTLQPARLMKRYSTLLTLGWGMFLGGLLLTAFMRPWSISPSLDVQTLLLLGFIVLFGTIFAFYFYLSGVGLAGAANASMLACVEPVSAALFSALWLKVRFAPMDLLGFAFVLSTVFIISIKNKKEENREDG